MRVFLIGFLLTAWAAVATAAPCMGPTQPQKRQVVIGLQSYALLNRYQEHSAGELRSWQDFFLLSYGLTQRFSVDLKGGAGYIKQHPGAADELDYPTYMGGGYGFRYAAFSGERLKATVGFQHISIHPHSIDVGVVKHKAVLDDWQFSGLVSFDCKRFIPYIGARWSRADYIHWIDGTRDRVRSDRTKSFGVIAGFDVPLSEDVWVTFEASALDSEALALSLQHRF